MMKINHLFLCCCINISAIMKEKKDIISPAILKLGVALAFSFAGFLFSRLKNQKSPRIRPPPGPMCPSDHVVKADVQTRDDSISVGKHEDTFRPRVAGDDPTGRNSGEKDGYLLPEFSNVVEEYGVGPTVSLKELETSKSDFETVKANISKEKEEYELEIRYLRAMISDLQEREKNLELQLLEFYGLKEQESTLVELQKRLELSLMENKLVTLKMETLMADNRRLQEQVAEQTKFVSELDAARAKITLLRKTLKSEAQQNKLQILKLRERVIKLQEQEAARIGSDMQVTMEKMRNLEAEIEDLKEVNSKLQQENSELARKCESTQVLANSVLEDPQTEVLQKLKNRLSQENEELEKKIEQLQVDRCSDIEELVYLRWINACLRYELRNFKPDHGKTAARDLSRSLSPESELKAKKLILEYAYTEETDKGVDFDLWSTSQNSHVDSDELSVSPKDRNSSKVKFLNKLRRLIRGKEAHFHGQSHGSTVDRREDSDSWAVSSSGMSSGTEIPFSKVKSVSPDFYGVPFRRSMDIPKTKESEFVRRYSDIETGSIFEHKRAFSARITGNFMSPEDRVDRSSEKMELKKFAEVLKDSEGRERKVHRKSTSLGSLLGVWSSTLE